MIFNKVRYLIFNKKNKSMKIRVKKVKILCEAISAETIKLNFQYINRKGNKCTAHPGKKYPHANNDNSAVF